MKVAIEDLKGIMINEMKCEWKLPEKKYKKHIFTL